MSATARGLLLVLGVGLALMVIGGGWLMLSSGCQYERLYGRISPTERYIAEVYGADCGMRVTHVVVLRDRFAARLPNLEGGPAGTQIASHFSARGRRSDVRWDGEERLVLIYDSATPPALERTEWGGVRIEASRAQ